jgi:hypothetical protein
MASNINELYDSLSDDPLFTENFKSASDLESYLKSESNAKLFKKVYGAELDETQLMGLKKKEDTSSSSSVSVGAEPMVETPELGVQDNNPVLGAADQGIDLSGQPLPEMGYGKGIPLPDPAKQKYVDGELIKIQKFLESNNPGAAFAQLRQLKMQNPDLKLTPEQNATLTAPLNKFLESRKAQPGSASLIKTITKDASDLGLTLETVKPELTPQQKAVSAAVKQIPAEKLKPDTQPISEDVVGDMKEVESDFFNKLEANIYDIGAGIYRIPEFAYGLTKSMMTPEQRATIMLALEPTMKTIEENNIPAQVLEKKAQDMKSKMQVVEGTISDRFAEGDYANGFTMVSNSIAESLPSTFMVVMTGGGSAGLGLMGLSTAVSKKRELDEMQKRGEIDIDEQDKYINAVATGTSEALFEAIGIGSIARVSKNIFAREGVDEGKEILRRGILDNFDNLIKKYPVLLGPLAEGMSEVATTIAQNAADKYTGVDPERDLFQGATDALIVGSAMGAGFGGALKIAQVVLPKPQRNKITENQQTIQRASELVQDPNITPEKKEALDNLAAQSSAENIKLEKEGLDKLNTIPEDKRMEFTQLSEKAANIEDQIDTEQDPLIKKALESELTTTQTKIKEIENAVQKQTTSEVPVQPETSVGQEMVEGEPQAEPQVAAQEGQKEEVVDVSNKEQVTRLKERVSDAVKTRIVEQAEKGINTLKSVLPNFNIEVYENTDAYNTAISEIGGEVNSAGTFSYQQNEDGTFSGKILVNLDTANERTINHEITHGILLGKFGDTPEIFTNFHNQVKGVVSETDNARLNEFINQYDEASKPEEYLAELAGIMSTEGTTLSPDIITKIAKIVNQIISTITGGTFTPFAETANKADVIDFFNQISTSMQKGEAIGETALDGVTEQINPSAPATDREIDTSSLNQKYTLIQDLGLERFPEMKNRIETGKTLSELGPVTAHLTFSDRLATGKVGERTYLGGILFGAATNNFWASFSKGRVNGIINGAPKNEDGYRYLMPAVLTEEAHMSNMDMLNTSLELVEKNIADGTISPQDADTRIKKALNKTDLKKFGEIYNASVGTNITAESVKKGIDEAIVKSKSTFEERKSFLESILGKANIDLTKRFGNLPSFNELANGLAEPITQGFEYGDILLTIRTKGDLTAVQPQPGDPDYHPSYPWVIRSSAPVETLVFKNAYNAVDVFPKVTNKQGQTLTYEDYKAKYGEGAKSRYLGYMGGRSTMSTSVTEPIVSEAKVASKEIKTEEDFQKANEDFGTEDGQIGFKTKSQLNPKEVSTVSQQISNSVSEQQLDELKKLINNDVTVPTKTKTVYKLFKVKKGFPGELFPLFVGANQSVTTGEWIQAKAGELTKTKEGKTMVKSTLGPLAYRPGWHSGDIPLATHIGSKVNKNDKAPSFRSDNQVWAEVEVGDDVDWQTVANERAEIAKNGKPIAKTAHITDQVPLGGSYKYKTNSNMTGSWVISGEMKVNKVLTQAEVDQLNKAEKAKDLPRREPFDYQAYGFDNDGSVQNPKQVVSNQVARAYLDAKETGNNPELVSAVDSALGAPIQTKAQKTDNFKEDVVKSKKNEDNDHTVTLNGEEVGMMYYDSSQKAWVNANFDRSSEKPYTSKWIYGDMLGDTKQEAIDELVRRYKENKPEVSQQENKVEYTKDEILNTFLNALNNTNPLQINPLRPREFIYNNKAALEFNRFDKGNRKEVELQDISVVEKGKGEGKAVMKDITNAADKSGVTLTLEAKPFGRGGLNKKDLIDFYKKNGFEVDWKDAYGGDFDSEQELIRYALKNESEGVPMKRTPLSLTQAETKIKSQKYTLEKGPLRPSYGAPAPNVMVYQDGKMIDNPRTGDIYWYYGEANKFVNEKNSKITTKSQLTPSAIKTEYDADIAAGNTATEAMKNLLAQGYSYNQIGDQLGRANIQESYNAAIAEMGKEVAAKYSETQEARLKEIEDYLGANPVSVEQLRADLIGLGYADLEIFTAMNRNLFSQSELFQAFGETYRKTVQNAIADSRYPAQDLTEVAEDTRSIKVTQSVSDLTDNFADFSFIDANVLVEHMVNTVKKSGLVEAANALAEHLKGKNVDQIPQALLNFSQLTSIAGRILVMARSAKKDMSDLVIGSIERGPIRISDATKQKVKQLVSEYNLKSDVYAEARETFGKEKDDASFAAMLNAEAEFYQAGDNLMDILEKLKLRYWNDVLTSFSTRALLSIATTPLSLWGNIEQGILGQVSSPVRAAISKVKKASKKTNRLSFADYWNGQRLSSKKGVGETWAIIAEGKYTTPDMAEKYMDGIADVNAQKDYMDVIKFVGDMFGSQMKKMTDEEFASAYDKLMYETSKGDIKLTNGKTYTVGSAMFRAVMGTIPEITGRMLAISGDRIAFHGYKTRALMDYVRMVEQEVKSGKRDTELQKYIAEELGGTVKNSDMDLLINLSTVLSDYSEFGKEESLKRVFMNDNFATNLMGGARKGLKNRITEQYFKYLTAPTATSKVFAGLKKAGYQGLDVATWTVSPFTRVPVNVLAAGMQNTIPFVSPLFAIASYSKLKTASDAFNKKYGANLEAAMKSESAQKQYEKDRQELFEKRRQHNYNLSAVATSAAVASVVLSMALSGALTPPAGADDEDRRKTLNAMGLRPSEFNITYYSEYLSASPEQREKMMINRGWKQGDKVLGYQNMGLIGQTMGYFSSNAYDFGKEKVKKASYIKSMQPTISGISSFFSLGESSIQNISALQTIGLALDISKATDQQKAAEKLIANMVAATGAVAAPNALNFFAKGQAQTQMSLGEVIPSQEVGGIAILGRVGIQAAAKLSKNSQVFGRKTDYFQSGIGVFGEELKLNLTGMEPGTGAAYFSAALNPFGLRSFKQVKQGNVKADFANNLYSTVMGMSMVSDELGLMDEKGQPLNMWSVLSINKDNKYEIGEGVNKVTLSLPFDLYRKELQILGDLRYNGFIGDMNNFKNNLEVVRSNENNPEAIETAVRNTFQTMRDNMTNSLSTYESELTSLRLRGILNEMDKRGLITAEDKKRIEIALPGQFIK